MCRRKNKQINKKNKKKNREGWLERSERGKYLFIKKQRDKTRNKTGRKKVMKERK
jgi:predicted transcriptional regulator of viral defense system